MDLRGRTGRRLTERLSPERTRRPTLLERRTVRRLSWATLVRLNVWLEAAGRAATAAWVLFLATIVLGIDWQGVAEDTLNAGRPVRAALFLVVLVPTSVFLLARALLIAARWRVHRELWRRDVERLEAAGAGTPRGH
jgi:multisubunit Na+/H+ antiporter MnhG subunit